MSAANPDILVVSCGNPDAGDDAFGPLVTDRVRRLDLPPAVRVEDLGLRPSALFDFLPADVLVLVDAVRGPFPAESVIVLDWFSPERPALAHDDALSSHGLDLARQIELARVLGWCPRRVLLVAAPVETVALGLRPREDRVRRAVECVRQLLEEEAIHHA
ncbi:MAG: hydrogenase maturation protease [Gemmatimonadetes bacterium]|nr:hydrogenase maturation protease [Gemmatimonadota bacterium]